MSVSITCFLPARHSPAGGNGRPATCISPSICVILVTARRPKDPAVDPLRAARWPPAPDRGHRPLPPTGARVPHSPVRSHREGRPTGASPAPWSAPRAVPSCGLPRGRRALRGEGELTAPSVHNVQHAHTAQGTRGHIRRVPLASGRLDLATPVHPGAGGRGSASLGSGSAFWPLMVS